MKFSKCVFDVVEFEFLGFIVSLNKMTMNPEKVDTIAK